MTSTIALPCANKDENLCEKDSLKSLKLCFENLANELVGDDGATSSKYYKEQKHKNTWVQLVSDLMKHCPDYLDFSVFRDEYLDVKGAPLGKANQWLRRRTFHSGETSLTLKTPKDFSNSDMYDKVSGDSNISKTLLVKNAETSFPIVVSWYDCLRIYYHIKAGTLHFDLLRLGPKLFYHLITFKPNDYNVDCLDKVDNNIPCNLNVFEVLYYQNPEYYFRLLSNDKVPSKKQLKEMSKWGLKMDTDLQCIFDEFSKSLLADPKDYL